MNVEPSHLSGVTKNLNDSDSSLSFDEWVEGLTQDARRCLLEHRYVLPPLMPGREEVGGTAGQPTPSQIYALLTEVRDLLVNQRQTRDYYSTEEAAQILGKANWTVREWCRLGRVNAEKRRSGRGRSFEWVIPHAELLRVQKEGLLPAPKH